MLIIKILLPYLRRGYSCVVSRPFKDARRRLNWARKDFEQFKRVARRFFKRCPHRAIVELSADGTEELHKIKLAHPLPDSLGKRVVSTLENLRHALDLATFSVAECAKAPLDHVHFPFSAKATDFRSRLYGACKGFPEEIHALFESFQPYQGGDDLLWVLNEMCNRSKHRIIAPFGMDVANTYFHGTGGPIRMPLNGWDSEKEELVYLVTKPGAEKARYKAKFSFEVVFREVPVVTGKPVVGVLEDLIRKVKKILDSTETVCRRIRLL